jgi:enoyl-CoA hydratase/carnithine racemase
MKGWSIGGSFERALLCDMRIAGESARMMLPEVKHGVIPDTVASRGSFTWQAMAWPPISR